MDTLKTTLEKIEKRHMTELKKKSTYSQICDICGDRKEIEECYPIRWSSICSEQCYNELLKQKYKERYACEIRGIPVKYREIEADKKMVKDNYEQNLFITGKSGVGKTVLAAGIAKECITKDIDFQWLSYPAFIMELQNLYRSDNESPFEKAKEIANFDGVLIIDDLGAEKMSDWVRQITYYIINEREQRMLSIIITSNFSLSEIAEQIDVRISSRIAGMCKSIKLSSKDRRLETNNKKWTKGESKRFNLERLL